VRFAGYAAIFDRPDRSGDIIRRGAFAKALGDARGVPLLWQHKSGAVVGTIEKLAEDDRGLRVVASLGSGPDARRAAQLLGSGKLSGLSFGYRVRAAKSGPVHRELIELDLVEVSLVARPMQPRARVHAIESNQ
jgi:HK97 family phage prohead protease